MSSTPDIVIIGSGVGGSTVAAGLAATGAEILILEAGDFIADRPENRDQRAIFQRGHFRPKETWYEADGTGFNPGNYYNVGGNSKFYGAVLSRYRRRISRRCATPKGSRPHGRFPMRPGTWYNRAEQMYQVRGSLGEDPTEPTHSGNYEYPAVPDEPPIADVRARLKAKGLHPFSLPLGVNVEAWLSKAKTPWDAHPNSRDGKMDAETAALLKALEYPNVRLETNAKATKLEAGPGGMIERIRYRKKGEDIVVTPKLVILSAGAVQSAALLLRSADTRHPTGLANTSDQVGRNFMNHNSSAVIAVSPTYRNSSIYQKTFGFNDFYLSDGNGGPPLGNVQLLGRISAKVLKGSLPWAPEWLLQNITGHAIDFYADERGRAQPGKPREGGWGPHRSSVAADELECASRTGGEAEIDTQVDRIPDRPRASPSTSARRLTNAAPFGSATIRQVLRSTLLPLLRPPQPFRGGCQLPADLGGGESSSDGRQSGAAGRRPHRMKDLHV